jgi:RNA polymerase sigma factor (sigma-70 family)
MLNRQQKVVLPHLCRWIGPPCGGDLPDRDLLERFLGQGDAEAFAALVRRHGPTVLGVCRRIVHDAHDAEDAFQATFLVLVRRARAIVKRKALGSWLYGVAYRVALKARAEAARRRNHERQAAREEAAPPIHEGPGVDVLRILDEEVNRLPDKYRRPLVLCYFQGKTYQEAARLLGWPTGTASVRLARARALLRNRLAVRGLSLSCAALAACLAAGTAPAAAVALRAVPTADAAVRFLTEPALAGVSTHVIALTEGVVKAMSFPKLSTVVGVALLAGMMFGGAGTLWHFAVTGPARAAEPPGADAGLPAVIQEGGADAAGPARTSQPSPSAPADPAGPAPAAAAGPPPRALASPAAEGARPLQTRIGLINLARVIKGSKKAQAIRSNIRAQFEQAHDRLEALKSHIQKAQAQADDANVTADRKDELARELRQLKREMEDEQQSIQAKITKSEGEALPALYREVEDAASRLAKRDGLELVLFYNDAVTEADFYSPQVVQRKLASGGLMPLVVAPGMDITDKIIEALNLAYTPEDGARR